MRANRCWDRLTLTWALMSMTVAGLSGLIGCDREPELAGMGAADAVLPVVVEQAERGPFQIETRFTGRVRPSRQVELDVREPGQVIELPAPDDSSSVTIHQPLIRLHSPELELEIQQVELERELAERSLQRERSLFELGLRPQSEVDATQSALAIASSRLERLELRRARLVIKAPLAGILFHTRLPAIGQWCPAGYRIGRIVNPASQLVEVVVPHNWGEVAKVRHALATDGLGASIPLTVTALSAEVDPVRGGRLLKLKPEDDGTPLTNGATVSVSLLVAARESAVTVPVESLVEADDGAWHVLRGPAVGERGSVRQAAVVPGPSNGRRVVIESGLEAGDWVVIATEFQRQGYFATHLGVGR